MPRSSSSPKSGSSNESETARPRTRASVKAAAKQGKEVDTESSVSTSKKAAAEENASYWIAMHDVFNLIALVPINGMNLLYLKMWWFSEEGAIDAFWVFFTSTVLYFVVDLAWIYLKPESVKSPKFIMGHHIVTMSYLYLPYYHTHLAWCMGACKAEIATHLPTKYTHFEVSNKAPCHKLQACPWRSTLGS